MDYLLENVPTFQRICAQLAGNIVIFQKVQPKVTKVELFEGLFFIRLIHNICLIR